MLVVLLCRCCAIRQVSCATRVYSAPGLAERWIYSSSRYYLGIKYWTVRKQSAPLSTAYTISISLLGIFSTCRFKPSCCRLSLSSGRNILHFADEGRSGVRVWKKLHLDDDLNHNPDADFES